VLEAINHGLMFRNRSELRMQNACFDPCYVMASWCVQPWEKCMKLCYPTKDREWLASVVWECRARSKLRRKLVFQKLNSN